MSKIFCLNGPPRCGKNSFANIIGKLHPRSAHISTVDFVKEIAVACGWNRIKTPENRKFLSDLKYLLSDWNDVPFKKVCEKIEQLEDTVDIIFIDVREPAELDRFKRELEAKTIFVDREDADKNQINSADLNVYNYKYDIYIDNNGTLEDLVKQAQKFLKGQL